MSDATLSPEQLQEAKRYSRWQLAGDLADRGLDLAYLAAMSFLFATLLDRWLADRWGLQNDLLRLSLFYIVLTGLHALISFPLSFFSGHVLEHRFGLSNQTLSKWIGRYLKRQALTMLIGLPVTLLLFAIIWTVGSAWWLVAAAAYFVLSVVLGQLAPVLILPLFYKIERLEDDALMERLRPLTDGTGLAIEGIYRMEMSDETSKANAMLAGLGKTRRVILGDTLLDNFSPEEIEAIFAHEVGHHVHRHVKKMIAMGLVLSLFGFLLCHFGLRYWMASVLGVAWQQVDIRQLPVAALPLLTLMLTLFGMFVEPVQNAMSRHFERQADTYALLSTGRFEAFRTAFTKLARQNKADPNPHPLEVLLFHSHPPIGQRIALVDKLAVSGITAAPPDCPRDAESSV